jgi:hypothetical protein
LAESAPAFAEVDVDRGARDAEDRRDLSRGPIRVVVEHDRESLVRRDPRESSEHVRDRLGEFVRDVDLVP